MANNAISNAKSYTVINPASRSALSNVSAPRGVTLEKLRPNIQNLTKFETKCLQVQLSNLESNTSVGLISLGMPKIGPFKANINANTVISYAGTYFSNVASVLITNTDHKDIRVGMVANIESPSVGSFGANTFVITKSVEGIVTAGNFIPGFTYRITSIGSTNFTLCGLEANVADVVVGNVFVANSAGTGTGTAFIDKNQIMLGSNHTISGDVVFRVAPVKVGKYQISEWLLQRYGYKNNDGSWASKDGVDSNEILLTASDIQDEIIGNFIVEQYRELIKAGAIREGDGKEIIAGMLALAYQYQDLGYPLLNEKIYNTDGTINLKNYSIGTKCNVWRNTGSTVDSQDRPGHIYFNGGRYAIATLGADVPE
jgi:hypothetical protein